MTALEPSFHLQIECKDLADYSHRFAKRFDGEFFVPTATPLPVDTEVLVHLVFSDGVPHVSGNAKVLRPAKQEAANGVIVRFVDQHTRTTGSFAAVPADDGFSDFDEAPPTRASAISQEMAESLKQKEAAPQERSKQGPAVIARAKAGASALPRLSNAQQTKPTRTPKPPADSPTQTLTLATPTTEPPADSPTRKLTLTTPTTEPPADSPTRKLALATPAPAATKPAQTPRTTTPTVHPEAEDSAAKRTKRPRKIVLLGLLLSGLAAVAVVMLVSSGASAPAAQQDTEQVPAVETSEELAVELAKKVQEILKQAEANAASGRLTGPNSALESLLQAKRLSPKHSQVAANLSSLADMFEQLATAAVDAGNLGEAAAHLQAALLAAPDRTQLDTRMTEIEDEVRGHRKETTPLD